MLTSYTVKDLYALALAEGEGMGTAYEYYAKRRVLEPWLGRHPRPKTMLIAGLPERYGLSLDFLLLGTELGADITIVDERPESFQRLFSAREALLSEGLYQLSAPNTVLVANGANPMEIGQPFDLVVSSEVLQRLDAAERLTYTTFIQATGNAAALFAPNADNPAHTNRSGLAGLHLSEIQELTTADAGLTGYLDMPPFPPGITRSEEQREQATTGSFENLVMWGLGHYARHENWVPRNLRKTQSHIVYSLTPA
ncbi:MAG: hypothetical protein R3C44_05050 [Chloroflexota bacterium]